MRKFWRELQQLEGTEPDSSASRALRDHRQLFMFLIALHPEFQPLCGQIIHKDPVPSLDSAISDLVVEETRLHSLSIFASTPISGSAPWSSSSGGQCNTTTRASSTDRTRLYCTICNGTGHNNHFCRHSKSYNHCKKTGQTERECFHLHPELLVKAQQRRSIRDFFSFVFPHGTSRHGSWYSSALTYRYPTLPCSDWITALAPVSIRRFLYLGFLYCLGYVFYLDFKFWCIISHDL